MICLAGPKVIAVASTPRWLTVAVENPNDTETTYSYMDKTLDSKYLDGADSMVGPFTRAEFDAVKKQFGLPEPQPL